MRIIKDHTNSGKDSKFPLKTTCEWCGSELEIEESDCKIGYAGLYHYVCPCCNRENTADEIDGVDITLENIKFPDHFYYFDEESTYPSPEEVKRNIKELLKWHRENKDDDNIRYLSGRSFYMVHKYPEEKEYSIIVAPNYYEAEIPFSEEDY